MSYNLPETLQVDSRLTIGSKKSAVITRGASNTTVQRTSAASASNSQLIWNVQLNNASQTLIDPYMYVEVPITVTISATGLGAPVATYLANGFALRQYPLASVTNTCAVMINNTSVSSNPCQFIHELSQNQDFYKEANCQSLCPIMPDQSPQYSTLNGSLKSPLNGYVSGGEHYSEARGSFNSLFTTTTSTNSSWVFTYTIREPIFNPLLDYDPSKKREGLAYVSLFNVQMNFLSTLSRMFSLDAVNYPAVTGISVNIGTNAQLVQTWLTAPTNQIMPPITVRSFNNLSINQTLQAAMAAGAQSTITSQSYSMNQIPRKIWVFVNDSQKDISTGYTKSDFCFSVEAITVMFNNKAGLLSNMNAADLYNSTMAEEGSIMTFTQARAFTGAVLVLDPSKLFGLADNQAPGMLGNFNFQVTLTCTNISNASVTPNINVVLGYDTLFTTSNASVSNLDQGYIKESDVLQANQLPASPASFIESDIYGGGFWDDVKSFASKAHSFVKDNKLISKGLANIPHPNGQLASQFASSIGYGSGRTSRRQMMEHAMRH